MKMQLVGGIVSSCWKAGRLTNRSSAIKPVFSAALQWLLFHATGLAICIQDLA